MFGSPRSAEKPLREQLLEARDAIIHQLQVLNRPLGFLTPPSDQAVANTLKRELGEINDELARIQAENA